MKTTWLLITCSLFVVGGILMILDGNKMGYFCAGFFALGLPVFALQFHPKSAYLHLTVEGFTYCSLFRAHTVRWEHVRRFAVMRVGLNRMVGWDFTEDHRPTQRGRALSKAISGSESALPDTYGMEPQELVDLMESLRLGYAHKQHI